MYSKSITFRLTLFFSTASTAALLMVGYLIGTQVEAHFESQDLMELNGKLELVRHILAKVDSEPGLEAVPQKLADAFVGHHDLAVAVVGPDHHMLFNSSDAVFPAALFKVQPSADASIQTRPMMWGKDGQEYRGIAATAVTGISGNPPAIVAVAVNIKHHREFMAAFQKSLGLAIAIGIVLTALLGWIAARRGLTPLRDMAKVAHGISANRLGERLPPESVPTELADLAIAFNGMLARLEDSFQRLSDFSADLAHELRTPISNLMTQTQVAISQTRSADEYREVLYSNLEEHERLARMIADMLFLAKADNGLIVPSKEKVDLATEVNKLFLFYEAYAEEQGVHLVIAGEAQVQGDSLMIRRALSNLLSNAIRHTLRGGVVRVAIERLECGETCLSVENPGNKIAPEHLPRLFDRFYRVDSARQKSSDGVGLGLAISKSIVEAHRGTIRVSSSDGLTCFMLTFPKF